jgi:hypothetical protein
MVKTRFDLEQEIMQCWNVVDDLKMLVETDTVSVQSIEAIRTLYAIKFEQLFATFEELVSNRIL